jgi:hypothetical protein
MVVFLLFVAAEIYLVAYRPAGVASAGTVAQRFVVHGAADRSSIVAQSFRMGADGLSAVSLHAVPMTSFVGGMVTLELWEIARRDSAGRALDDRLVRHTNAPAATLVAAQRLDWMFEPISPSAGHRYRLAVKLPAGLDLEASRLRRDPAGELTIDGRPVWGALLLRTAATRATVIQRMAHALRSGGAWPANFTLVMLLVLLAHGAVWCVLRASATVPEQPGLADRGHRTGESSLKADLALLHQAVRVVLVLAAVAMTLELAARLNFAVRSGTAREFLYHDFVSSTPELPLDSSVMETTFLPAQATPGCDVVALSSPVSATVFRVLSDTLTASGIRLRVQGISETPGTASRHEVRPCRTRVVVLEDALLPAAYDNFVAEPRPLLPFFTSKTYWLLYRNSVLFLTVDEKLSLTPLMTDWRVVTFANESLLRIDETILNAERTDARLVVFSPPHRLGSGVGRDETAAGRAVEVARQRLRALLTLHGVRGVDVDRDHRGLLGDADFADTIHLNDSGSVKTAGALASGILAELEGRQGAAR